MYEMNAHIFFLNLLLGHHVTGDYGTHYDYDIIHMTTRARSGWRE